jgi:hypothetical protein
MCEASNYVVKLRAEALCTECLNPLGHFLDFATFRIRLSSWWFYLPED